MSDSATSGIPNTVSLQAAVEAATQIHQQASGNLDVVICEVTRLNIGPNEVLAVHLPAESANWPEQKHSIIKAKVLDAFQRVGIEKVLVVRGDVRLEVIADTANTTNS